MKTLLRRLRRLVARHPLDPLAEIERQLQTDEDWLAFYEREFKRGVYDHEPEFPAALENYRRSLVNPVTWSGEPFQPPANFMPDWPLQERRAAWRLPRSYDEVNQASGWLGTFLIRIADKKPPVTKAEFETLASWFRTNEAKMQIRMTPREAEVVLPRHRHRIMDAWGNRQINETIEELRELKARFADLDEAMPDLPIR